MATVKEVVDAGDVGAAEALLAGGHSSLSGEDRQTLSRLVSRAKADKPPVAPAEFSKVAPSKHFPTSSTRTTKKQL